MIDHHAEIRCGALRSVGVPALAGLVLVGLAACGTNGPDGISREEAEEASRALFSSMGQAAEGLAITDSLGIPASGAVTAGDPRTAAARAETETVSRRFDRSAACPEGGTVSFSGSLTGERTEESGSTSALMDFQGRADYEDCRVAAESDVFVLSTPSPLELSGSGEAHADSTSASGQIEWSVLGTLEWDRQEGRSGSCDFDFSISMSLDADTTSYEMTGSASGTMCGYDVDDSWNETWGT